MTDAEQNIVWQASYSPFGSASVSVESVENNIRFPGQYYDAETGLHYNYFRYYDVEIGRYVTSDPIGLAGGINTYGYVGGNPVNAIDYLGLCSCNLPNSQDFMDNYPDYYNYDAADVWELIGGQLEKGYGADSPDGAADSCAARASYALNKSGAKISSGFGANRVWGGNNDGERYIISARNLNQYLRNTYGTPDRTLTNSLELASLWWDLEGGQVAFVSSNHHFGVFTTTYSDRYLVGRLGDVWILPTGDCSCSNSRPRYYFFILK